MGKVQWCVDKVWCSYHNVVVSAFVLQHLWILQALALFLTIAANLLGIVTVSRCHSCRLLNPGRWHSQVIITSCRPASFLPARKSCFAGSLRLYDNTGRA